MLYQLSHSGGKPLPSSIRHKAHGLNLSVLEA